MYTIQIDILNKHAAIVGAPVIVCGNDDYAIEFTWDEEWDPHPAKTARFVYVQNGAIKYEDVLFTGDTIIAPVLSNTKEVLVGVFAGDLRTSTPARIPCEASIRCGTGAPADPSDDVYDQIMTLLTQGAAEADIEAAVAKYLDKYPIEGVTNVVYYTPQALTEEQKATARDNIGAISQNGIDEAVNAGLETAKANGDFKGEPGEPGRDGSDGVNGDSIVACSTTAQIDIAVASCATSRVSILWAAASSTEYSYNSPKYGPKTITLNPGDIKVLNLMDGVVYSTGDIGNIRGAEGAPGAAGATGPQGPKGDPGEPGVDGVSPEFVVDPQTDGLQIIINGESFFIPYGNDGESVTVETKEIPGGNVITLYDVYGAHPFTIYNGEAGTDGADGKDGADAFQFLAVTDMSEVESYLEEMEYTPYNIYVLWGGTDGTTYSYPLDQVNPTITLNKGDIWRFTQKNHKINGAYLITNIKGDSGERGEPGKDGAAGRDGKDGITPSFSIGDVITTPAGSNATVGITGTTENPVLNFALPEGNKGATGKSAYDHAKDGGYLGTEEEFDINMATAYIDWFGNGISIPEGADLNTYKTNGKYYCSSESRAQTLLNRPDKMNTNFCMWVFTRTTSSIKSQLMLTLTGKLFLRSSSSSAWRAWTSPATFEQIEELMASVKEELRAELAEVIATTLITQEAGDSETLIMSQKAVTDLVNEAIGSGKVEYETVDSIEEMTDTSKSYVLSTTGTIWVYGEAGLQPNFTNKADPSSSLWKEGYRISGSASSDGYVAEKAGSVVTNNTGPVEIGSTVRVQGINLAINDAKVCMCSSETDPTPTGNGVTTINGTSAVTVISCTKESTTFTSNKAGYWRFSGPLNNTSADVIITIDEEIAYVSGYAWYDTNMKPSESGNGNFVDLLVKVNKNKANIEYLEDRVTAIETGSNSLTIPSFWQSAVDACVEKIKNLQIGKNCVTFPFFSDNHTRSGNTQYMGVLIAHVMKECNIPYCFCGGDAITSAVASTADSDAEFRAQAKAFDMAMSYIPEGRFCMALGNHEGYLKKNPDIEGSATVNYNRDQAFDIFLREEAIAQNKHYGIDGTYYYIDDIVSKVRWIVLNTNGIDNNDIDDAQLTWFENTALKFNESGWGVVIISHIPITNHYDNSNITNSAAVISMLQGYMGGDDANKADIIGWYSGHIHRDRIYSGVSVNNDDDTEGDVMGFKQVTITSDHTTIAYPLNNSPTSHPVSNDDKSHAIDFVTINKDTRTVNITRLGIGEDRSYTY